MRALPEPDDEPRRNQEVRALLLEAGVPESGIDQYIDDLLAIVEAGFDSYFRGPEANQPKRKGGE